MLAEIALAAAVAVGPAAAAADLPPAQHEFRECVAQRESGGSYTAVNRDEPSTASGRYQFLDAKWRKGLAYMVADRLRDHGATGVKPLRVRLQATPISKWPPIMQDVGFAAVLNARGPWSGWRHWHYPGSACNRLAP